MRASSRLDAYLAGGATGTEPANALARVSVTDEDAALFAIARRRIESRLRGEDEKAARSSDDDERAVQRTSSSVIAPRRDVRTVLKLASIDPDDGDGGVGTSDDESASVATARQRERAADAILKHLVRELGTSASAHDGPLAIANGDAVDAWVPSGIDWNETPEFLLASSAASAKALREKYPDMFGGQDLLGA